MTDPGEVDPLERVVHWSPTASADYPYRATIGGLGWRVRVNDWPDASSIYTLLIDRAEVVDFDEWPESWRRPHADQQMTDRLVVCPYCLTLIEEGVSACNACREVITDALLETSRQELESMTRVPCKACRTPIPKAASICPRCRQRQDSPEPEKG